ncbi:MAG: plastocyanin/azurin family copper-binding protein [Bacteroidota bacterium]|nr:plastocyanin/azurin family copper-binding protein [Bacteroidota bacterium]
MKKQLLFAAVLLADFFFAHATVHNIQVANFQFTPSTVNAAVGDSITWTWVGGSHTTTCDPASQGSGNSLPAGAATWNLPMNSTNKSFTYILTVAGTYNYYCIPHAAFGMTGVINVSSVLPVTLIDFTATVTQNNKALLKWIVGSEQNTNYYSIQKSTDGKTFAEIAQVASGGNSSLQKTYSYTDDAVTNTKFIYYSLKMVDKDGRTQLSPIILFTNNNVKQNIIVSMSPNPISSPGHLMLQFNADKEGILLLQLYDMNGKLVKQGTMMAVTGINKGHFHIGELSAGLYTIVFSIDGKRETKRLQFE